jgi:hypothetical protein
MLGWAEIHRALLTQFSLHAEFYIEKVIVKDRDGRVLKLVNLNPGVKEEPTKFSISFLMLDLVV